MTFVPVPSWYTSPFLTPKYIAQKHIPNFRPDAYRICVMLGVKRPAHTYAYFALLHGKEHLCA